MRWLAALGGLVALVVGAALVVEPFASLELLVVLVAVAFGILAAGEIVQPRDQRWLSWGLAVVWLAAAGVVVLLPSITTGAIALVAGISLIINGVLRIASGLRARGLDRFEACGFGAAGVLLGALAVLWPGITLLVLAEVLALWIAISGWSLLLRAIRGRRRERGRHSVKPRFLRTRQAVLPVLALGSSLVLVAASLLIQATTTQPSGFYATPASITQPAGTLIRAQPFDGELPEGAQGWRILYVTSRDEGVLAVASALVVAPESAGPDTPVVLWAHGTTGIERSCAPSLSQNFATYGPLAAEAISSGWALVAPDYIGLGTEGPSPYMIGQGEGRAVLDAVRAAHQIPRLSLSDSTVLWGHSQGGHAALWAGLLAPTYAPDLELSGIGATSVASDLPKIIGHLQSEAAGVSISAFLVSAYVQNYPDVKVDDYVRSVLQVPLDGVAARCNDDTGVLLSIAVSAMVDRQVFIRDPQTGPLGARLAENVPRGRIDVPVFIGQGRDDLAIPADVQAAYVEEQCAAGTSIDYRTYPNGHDDLVAAESALIPDLISWTEDRFAGGTAEGC